VSPPPSATLERVEVLGRAAVYLHRRGPLGAGPPVVLVHGAGGSHRSFDELVAAFDQEDVILPALPGRGGTEGPPPATATEAAASVRALLTAIGVDRFALMGHSYGGAIALELALADAATPSPGITSVALVATGARLRVHPAILAAARAAAAGEGPPVDLRPIFQPGTDPALVARFEARTADVPAASTLADWIAVNAFDRLGALGSIRAPVVAVAGASDALTPPRYAQYFCDHVAGARAVIVPGAGHMLPIEHPAAVVEALRALSSP
jgi:pimeloyl-ACP methyl ester carboxylesterase